MPFEPITAEQIEAGQRYMNPYYGEVETLPDYVDTANDTAVKLISSGLVYTANIGNLKPMPVVYPDSWVNVYAGHVTNYSYTSRADADAGASGLRIGVIHLAADGTLTMEAP